MSASAKKPLPDGVVAVVKKDCATCVLVSPVLDDLAKRGVALSVYTQDDPAFPPGSSTVIDDTNLEVSWFHDIETVPTLIRVSNGEEQARTVGWSRTSWQDLTGEGELGPGLPDQRPGCGSLSVDPSLADELMVRFGGSTLHSRRVEIAVLEDEMEAAFDRGWSDGLPIIPPTEARVLRMLEGTSRHPQDVVAIVPPDLNEVTVEQVAVNAVMAGCKPEYLPVVLAAVEAACTDEFNMHGLIATTFFSGPIVVVNGPIAQRIGMNSGSNVLGQGNRANSTIGRALQLVVRNLGGGRPALGPVTSARPAGSGRDVSPAGETRLASPNGPSGSGRDVSPAGETRLASPNGPSGSGVDMSLMGAPSKLGLAFAEREHDSPFEPLSVSRGLAADTDAVTLFAGQGPTPIADQLSRTPESLVRSFAAVLRIVWHPKLVMGFDAMLVVGPEHGRVLREAGWDRARLQAELDELLTIESDSILQGVDGIAEGLPAAFAGKSLPKFRPGGLQIVHAGGDAGLFSAVLGGWVGGAKGSEPVTRAITDVP